MDQKPSRPTREPGGIAKDQPTDQPTVLPANTFSNPVILVERGLDGRISLAQLEPLKGLRIPIEISGDVTIDWLLARLGEELSDNPSFALVVGSGERLSRAARAAQVFTGPKWVGGSDVKGPHGGGGPVGIPSPTELRIAAVDGNLAPLSLVATIAPGMPVVTNVGFLLSARGRVRLAAQPNAGYESYADTGMTSAQPDGSSLYVRVPGTTLAPGAQGDATTALSVNVVYDGSRPADPSLGASVLGAVDLWVYGHVDSFVTGGLWLQLPSPKVTVNVVPPTA